MKKAILLTVMFTLPGLVNCLAGEVPEELARRVAANFMGEVTGMLHDPADLFEVGDRADGGDAPYFVFALEPEGWVIVSADGVAYPIIGFSETGLPPLLDLPPAFGGWMDNVRREIVNSRKKRLKPSHRIAAAWERLSGGGPLPRRKTARSPVGPLLKTTWDQDRYYNEQCPEAPNALSYAGGHAFAGCVATAMAQILKYHAHPAQGVGEKSYDDPPNRDEFGNTIDGSAYGTQSASFGNTIYDWEAMPDSISSSNFEVARLIYHCGVSVGMNFGPTGSSGSLDAAADALVNHFKYDESIFSADRVDYSAADWAAMLRNEIDAGRPVLYRGEGTGGHAFICDGYKDGDYFHFNWGWDGHYNGYFLISGLTPDTDNYSYEQQAFFDIKPAVPPALAFPYHQGFEEGTVPSEWRLSGDRAALSTAESKTGGASLMLGTTTGVGYNIAKARLKINVPENARLSFWVKRGFDPLPSEYNQHKAVLLSEYGNTELEVFFNGDFNDGDWTQFSLDLTPWANKVVQLYFEQFNTSTDFNEWMYIDDVEITGNTVQLPQVSWDASGSSQTVAENTGGAAYAVRLSAVSAENITVPFSVSGTAKGGGVDHGLSESGSITIPANSLTASKTFSITDDGAVESDETVVLTLRSPANATLGTPATLSVTIEDDDEAAPDPDGYEQNDTEASAFDLPVSFIDDQATLSTTGATIHTGGDIDFYRFTLMAGYKYTVSATAQDRLDGLNGATYTGDVRFACKTATWSPTFEEGTADVSLEEGGEILFRVEPTSVDELGSYGLEIDIVREKLPGLPILSVAPTAVSAPSTNGWITFNVSNAGEGTLDWSAAANADWLTLYPQEASVDVNCRYNNTGQERTGTITFTAPGAENSPQTVQVVQATGVVVSSDPYEPNDQETGAAQLTPAFTDGEAVLKTTDATLHSESDIDYYVIALEDGYDYTVSARLHDAYDSADGQSYGADVLFACRNGQTWSEDFDTQAPEIAVADGGLLNIKVTPYYYGQMGTYALELTIQRVMKAVPMLSVSPASHTVPAVMSQIQFEVLNVGEGEMGWSAAADSDWMDVDFDGRYIYVTVHENTGAERSGEIAVRAPAAPNSPQAVMVGQAAGSDLAADPYEPNDDPASAGTLTLNFADDYTGTAAAENATLHTLDDIDYYRLDLPSGYTYTLTPRVHDSYDSGDGAAYTADVKFDYDAGPGWTGEPNDTLSSPFTLSGGGTVMFKIEPYWYGEKGSYALEISVVRIPEDLSDPFLFVPQAGWEAYHTAGCIFFEVSNLGGGEMAWEVADSADWLAGYHSPEGLWVCVDYNFGAARTATVTVSADGALNAPRTIDVRQEAGTTVDPDAYEANEEASIAAALSLDFVNDMASLQTSGASVHAFEDQDWYKVDLPSGYDYTVSGRIQDRYSSDDGEYYACDVKFYLRYEGTDHGEYDTEADSLRIEDGGVLYVRVEPWSYGEAGNYALDLTVSRVARSSKDATGDLNKDGSVDLEDAILALKVVAKVDAGVVLDEETDIDGDRRIGLKEAVYLLRRASEN